MKTKQLVKFPNDYYHEEIEIDMDAVEKFAKNTKGYTKKNEGALNESAFSPEAVFNTSNSTIILPTFG